MKEKKDLKWSEIGFGYMKTEYRFQAVYEHGKWSSGKLIESEIMELHEGSTCLHYSQECFEGMKAQTGKDGKVLWVKERKELTKMVANWIINKLPFLLSQNDQSFAKTKVSSENFAEFIKLLYQNKLNTKTANQVLEIMVQTGGDPSQIMDDQDLGQISSEEIESIAEEAIKKNPEAVEDYKAGKAKALQHLMGEALKASQGKADPAALRNEILHQLK